MCIDADDYCPFELPILYSSIVEDQFEALKKEWHDATMYHSNPAIIMEHEACKKNNRTG